MPLLYHCTFNFYIYPHDHNPPNIHYNCSGHEAVFSIQSGELIVGTVVHSSDLKFIHDWILKHREELMLMWNTKQFRRLD